MNVKELVEFAQDDSRFRKLQVDDTKQTRLVPALGWGVRYARKLIQTHVEWDRYEQTFTLTLDGSGSYPLPRSCGTIKHMEDSDTRLVVSPLMTRDRGRFYGDGTDFPTGETVRIFYVPDWPTLLHGTASTGSETTVRLPTTSNADFGSTSREDDRYNGTKFEIVSGTGTGQILLATDYVGLTRTATVTDENGDAITTAPDETSVISTYLGDIDDEYLPFAIDYALYWLTQQRTILDRLGTALRLVQSSGLPARSPISEETGDDPSNLSSMVYMRKGRTISFMHHAGLVR